MTACYILNISVSFSSSGGKQRFSEGWSTFPLKTGLRGLGWFSLEKDPGKPYCGLPVGKEGLQKRGKETFYIDSDRKKGNSFKFKEGIFRLNVRRKLFTVRVLREVVGAPSVEVFKTRLDGTLSNLV